LVLQVKDHQDLDEALKGRVIVPEHPEYDQARKLWNAMIDKRPAVIARVKTTEDVARAVRYARDNELQISVRGGGHNVAGFAVADQGLVIDFSEMTEIVIDPEAKIARAQPGPQLIELVRAAEAHGLGTVVGTVSDTGLSGLTLGGGWGWLSSKYGLTADNVVRFEMVTVEGEVIHVSADENPDLFWALKGGGGNFGVVTGFEIKLYPVGQMLAGLVAFPSPAAPEVLRFFREFAEGAPDELGLGAAMLTSPAGPAIGIALVYFGEDLAKGEEVLKPVRQFGQPIMDTIAPIPYSQVAAMIDDAAPIGIRDYWKSDYVAALGDDLIEDVCSAFARVPSPQTAILMLRAHGEVTRLPSDATAFPHRGNAFDMVVSAGWLDAADDEVNIAWAKDLGAKINRHSIGVYVNTMGNEGEGRIRAAYGPNYDRLVEMKNKYDPTNVLRLNQNIKPTA
jgi:FAD/FMN-containing dehydrogenase